MLLLYVEQGGGEAFKLKKWACEYSQILRPELGFD